MKLFALLSLLITENLFSPIYSTIKIKAPIVVVGCKVDLRDETQPVALELFMGPIMKRYREIETCIECSAVTLTLVCLPQFFFLPKITYLVYVQSILC